MCADVATLSESCKMVIVVGILLECRHLTYWVDVKCTAAKIVNRAVRCLVLVCTCVCSVSCSQSQQKLFADLRQLCAVCVWTYSEYCESASGQFIPLYLSNVIALKGALSLPPSFFSSLV